MITWGQAQFSFRFVTTFRMARRNENRAWYKPSSKRLPPTFLIDWQLPNQPIKITSVACFSSTQIFHAWEKCRLADLKIGFIFWFFQIKIKQSAQSHLTPCEIKGNGALEFKILKFLFYCCLNIFMNKKYEFSEFPWHILRNIFLP